MKRQSGYAKPTIETPPPPPMKKPKSKFKTCHCGMHDEYERMRDLALEYRLAYEAETQSTMDMAGKIAHLEREVKTWSHRALAEQRKAAASAVRENAFYEALKEIAATRQLGDVQQLMDELIDRASQVIGDSEP